MYCNLYMFKSLICSCSSDGAVRRQLDRVPRRVQHQILYPRELYSHPDGDEDDFDILIANVADASEKLRERGACKAARVAPGGQERGLHDPNKPKSLAK